MDTVVGRGGLSNKRAKFRDLAGVAHKQGHRGHSANWELIEPTNLRF